jgi:glucosylceramidase
MKNLPFSITSLITGMLLMTHTVAFAQIQWIESTNNKPWVKKHAEFTATGSFKADASILTDRKQQVIDGFGACFNELGWTALSVLDDKNRTDILKNLFDRSDGLKLNICRMPIGANDYARDYYSLNDSANDFEMKYFSIERDRKTLIPYIKSAMMFNPGLKIWGSPWCPPSWMKTNNHYACRPGSDNGLTEAQSGREDVTQFRMQPVYLRAYALYFTKYIQAFRKEGINITGIHVQNEMNSCQNFPSCIWTASDLGTFIGQYLGPFLKLNIPDAEIWYGTFERPSVSKIDTILQNTITSKYITGVSFQWAGKQAIPVVHLKYPELKLMQSETECGNGTNDWSAAEYTFSLMKLYFESGVSVYSFWNSILDETGKSMWGWKQNSMITVNSKSREIIYNPEFYLLKHFSFFVQPGSRKLMTSGKNDEILAFANPDNSLVIIIENKSETVRMTNLNIADKQLIVQLQPHSFNTFLIDGK